METLVTRPIETELKGISGVKEIRSTSSEGLSTIQVEFNPEVDLDTALQKVREKVDLAKADLPPEVGGPHGPGRRHVADPDPRREPRG